MWLSLLEHSSCAENLPFSLRKVSSCCLQLYTETKDSSVSVCICRDATHIKSMHLLLSLLHTHIYICIYVYTYTSRCTPSHIHPSSPTGNGGPGMDLDRLLWISALFQQLLFPITKLKAVLASAWKKTQASANKCHLSESSGCIPFLHCHCIISCYPRLHAAKAWY